MGVGCMCKYPSASGREKPEHEVMGPLVGFVAHNTSLSRAFSGCYTLYTCSFEGFRHAETRSGKW